MAGSISRTGRQAGDQRSATGGVSAVDTAAKTITIAHERVSELQWPAMTMMLQAQEIDLSSVVPGDHVLFHFTSAGMDGTITSITPQ